VLDVGSGDSWFASQLLSDLPASARVDCWDTHYSTVDLAEQVHPQLRRIAAQPAGEYPLVLALDVFEHVDDVGRFVDDVVAPLVASDGVLVASVPAYQWLFTGHDEALGHHRRYSRADLRTLLARSFTVVAEGSLFTTLIAPRVVHKLAERLRRSPRPTTRVESEWTHGAAFTRAVVSVLGADMRVATALRHAGIRLPGLSLWAVCTPNRGR
jgi:2-polyprenyl-3-methyl-5-hydroxy-6-metoxy-1,4-benzoquinol methylase